MCEANETLSVITTVDTNCSNTWTNLAGPGLTFTVWRPGGGVGTLLLLMCPAGAGVQLLQHDGTQLVQARTVQPRLLPDAVNAQHLCRQALRSTTPKSVSLEGKRHFLPSYCEAISFIHSFAIVAGPDFDTCMNVRLSGESSGKKRPTRKLNTHFSAAPSR